MNASIHNSSTTFPSQQMCWAWHGLKLVWFCPKKSSTFPRFKINFSEVWWSSVEHSNPSEAMIHVLICCDLITSRYPISSLENPAARCFALFWPWHFYLPGFDPTLFGSWDHDSLRFGSSKVHDAKYPATAGKSSERHAWRWRRLAGCWTSRQFESVFWSGDWKQSRWFGSFSRQPQILKKAGSLFEENTPIPLIFNPF